MIPLHITPSERQPPLSKEAQILATAGDHEMAPLPLDRLSHFFFTLDDIPYDVHRVRKDGTDTLYIMATLGYMPFTAENAERRQLLLDIISATRALSLTKFLIDKENRIIIAASFSGATMTAPDFLFYPLILFVQETRPFLSLIGQYL